MKNFRLKKEIQLLMQNQRGVALMMIMTAIILLMAIYGEFTFESKIARLKATNVLDKSQAKLLAESGLQLAMTRLKLYKEAYNAVQNNANAKGLVKDQLLNQLWEVPFIYPIPLPKNASVNLKDSVEKFSEDFLLDGELKVNIQNISNRMNLNMLRVDMTKYDPNSENQDTSSALDFSDNAILSDVSVDQSLFFLLKKMVDEKKEKDEAFEDRYSRLNYQSLITNLKYYISDFGTMSQDPLSLDAESSFQSIPLSPKFGPMGSSSELFAIPGWNDELVELIQNEFSVYPTAQIDFNKLTANMLKIFIPSMTDDNINDFFAWRDDPENPKFINSLPEFKNYIVENERLMTSSDFDERMKLFEQKGISFGANPNLFKVVSEGTFNRSIYTLVAYVLLPKNEPIANNPNSNSTETEIKNSADSNNPDSQDTQTNGEQRPNPGIAANQKTQLLEPRIIEIQIN